MGQEKISNMKLVKIGNLKGNDIVLKKDKNISPYHCEIFEDDEDNIFLTDLNSSKGSYINGKRLKGSTILNSNDIVKLGTTILPWKEYLKYQKQHVKIVKDNSKEKEIHSNKNTLTTKNHPNNIFVKILFTIETKNGITQHQTQIKDYLIYQLIQPIIKI